MKKFIDWLTEIDKKIAEEFVPFEKVAKKDEKGKGKKIATKKKSPKAAKKTVKNKKNVKSSK